MPDVHFSSRFPADCGQFSCRASSHIPRLLSMVQNFLYSFFLFWWFFLDGAWLISGHHNCWWVSSNTHGRQKQSGHSGLSTVPSMTGLCETYLAHFSIFIHIYFIFISFNLISSHLRRIHGSIRGKHKRTKSNCSGATSVSRRIHISAERLSITLFHPNAMQNAWLIGVTR